MEEYCVSCAQMKILEQNTDAAGLSYYQMMENAGTIAADRIVEITMTSPINDAKSIYPWALDRPLRARVYTGKGNNGGDGYVVARILRERGWNVTIVPVDGEPQTPDAIANRSLTQAMGISELTLKEQESESDEFAPDVIVDAIYGTGFHGQLRESGAVAARQIELARAQGARVFALDIPSGMGGDLTDEAELDPRCVRADVTITFHARKPVHTRSFAKKYCGKILVADIGIVDLEHDAYREHREEVSGAFEEFVDIVAKLRAPEGCPWDREQTHETLKKYFLEETQEVAEAIDKQDDENLCEELGDVLLQILLHAQIASETDRFDITDVIHGISSKMIRRHPWVFGDMKVATPEEGEALWEQIKEKEKQER